MVVLSFYHFYECTKHSGEDGGGGGGVGGGGVGRVEGPMMMFIPFHQ